MKKHAGPIIAVVLLLLPVLYVGSYLALVKPGNYWMRRSGDRVYFYGYRYYGSVSDFGEHSGFVSVPPVVFWPLEQFDRRVRTVAWDSPWDDSNFQSGPRPMKKTQ